MQTPEVFDVLMGAYHQDTFIFIEKDDDLIDHPLYFISRKDYPELKKFLEEILNKDKDGSILQELWDKSKAQIGVSNPGGIRYIFEGILKRLGSDL